MNRRVIQIFCMVVGMVLASSCGDECPVEQPYSVRVSVKDKNYLNISQFPQLSPVDENLPFRTYAGTLYYALYDASTGALIRESAVVSTEGEEKEYTLTFPGVPDGDYKLAVWGNLTTDYPAGQLPPEGKPSDLPDGYFEVTFSAGYGGGDTRAPVTGTDSRVRHLRYVIYKSTGEFVKEKVVLNTTDAAPSWPMAALKDTLPKGQYTAVFLANVEKTQFPIPVSGGGTNYADVLTNYQITRANARIVLPGANTN